MMMPESISIEVRRKCTVLNKDTGETEPGYFHRWFIANDGWPRALVELADGSCICVGHRKVIFTEGTMNEENDRMEKFYGGDST